MIFLDHFYIEDKNGFLYTVIGNRHPPQIVYAYLKYRPVHEKTIWCRDDTCYERVVPTYTPELVHGKTPLRMYDPYYDARIPAVIVSKITRVYDPRIRVGEIITGPKDPLEEEAGYYATLLSREANIPLNCIGITGSILARIHNPGRSDIDYIIYGVRCCEKILEAFIEGGLEFFKPFPPEKLFEWALQLARLHNIDVVDVLAIYRRWRRGVLESSREYSLAYSLDHMEPYTGNRWVTTGAARVKVLVENTPHTLNYPSKSLVREYRVLEVLYGSIKDEVRTLLSFENLYLPVIYEEGWLVVEGIIQWCPETKESRIVVGTLEHKGFVIPAQK